jgi:hypothetical protein
VFFTNNASKSSVLSKFRQINKETGLFPRKRISDPLAENFTPLAKNFTACDRQKLKKNNKITKCFALLQKVKLPSTQNSC